MFVGCTSKHSIFMMLLLVAIGCRSSGKTQKIADLILINGNIITVEENFPKAEALAVKGDRIMSLGENDEILKHKGEYTKVIDVEGKTVIPGLIDAHMHFIGLGKGSKKIYLDKTTDYHQVLDIVQEAMKKAKPGEWIMGSGWHTANWKDKEYPDNSELSRISQDHPVFLSGMATHAALVNKKALALAGITRATPDPEGGRILRNPISQEPTGLLLEKAQQLVTKLFLFRNRSYQKGKDQIEHRDGMEDGVDQHS